MTQAGGVAAPVGGQILSEVLPYLELQEDNKNEEEEQVEVIVPELRNKTVGEAKKEIKELGLEIEINKKAEEDIAENLDASLEDRVVTEQLPLPGIKIYSGSKVYLSI